MAEPKKYRFKVTAPDGTSADSQIFSYAPPGAPQASATVDASLIDVAPAQDGGADAGGPSGAQAQPTASS